MSMFENDENDRVETGIEEAAAYLAACPKDAARPHDRSRTAEEEVSDERGASEWITAGTEEAVAQVPPVFISPNFGRMPPELKLSKNWVMWASFWNGSKWTKRPIQINGYGASTTEPKHWSSFDDVKQAYELAVARGYMELREKGKPVRQVPIGGIGFVFDGQSDEDGLVLAGVDFDKVIPPVGEICSLAAERVKRLGSYCEQSVSRTGLHVILKAEPLVRGIAHNGTELYTAGRFFTMTGRAPKGAKITAAPEAFAALATELQAQKAGSSKDRGGGATASSYKNDEQRAGADHSTWFDKLPPAIQSEVVKYAALHVATNSQQFELTAHGGNYPDYFRLTLAIARSGVSNAEDIFVEAASTAKGADVEEKLRSDFQNCKAAVPHGDSVTVGTLFFIAAQCGADFDQWKLTNRVSLNDFYAYMPLHNYIFAPTGEPWPASSVNSRLGKIGLCNPDGTRELNENKKEKEIAANVWLDQNKPVEQMTWAPGLPTLIKDRLVSEGGWIERDGVACFNLYRPPTVRLGNASEANRWLDHVDRVFGELDAAHIVKFLAHRTQRPQEKINHALVLGGNQGIGKDTTLEPAKHAVGPWNFSEVSPQHLLGRFNGFLKSVILRVNEARDLGEINRYSFYDHMKAYTASPPDVLRVDEKNLREHSILNCCGVIITTNHKADGIFLPADDRRHYVAWSNLTKEDFVAGYWTSLWDWYEQGGINHVVAYLSQLDISSFDPKAPPPKTPAFWDIVDASRAPEEGELADVFDAMGSPDAISIKMIINAAKGELSEWVRDRKNRRVIPHRLEKCGFVPVRNDAAKDGLWIINGSRQVIYAKSELPISERYKAASDLARQGRVVDEVSEISDIPSSSQ